jgi:glutamine amidotransferase
MIEVTRRGHGDAIRAFAETGRPLLGICVGMQILFEGSEEFGDSPGLGVIAGRVMAVPPRTTAGISQRVPHIGWNELLLPPSRNTWDGTMMRSQASRPPAVYFVHSFVPHPTDPKDRLADFDYGGHRLCAAIKRDNITATQFHPERSGDVGLALLGSFIGS